MVVYWDENDSLFETYLEYDFYVSAIIHSNLNISSGDKYLFFTKTVFSQILYWPRRYEDY